MADLTIDTAALAHVPPPRDFPRPREYAHVVFVTRQPDAMIDWYCSVLGMQVVMRSPMINFLTWDDSQDRMAIIAAPADAAPRSGQTGLHHVAFTYHSLRDIITVYRHLARQGVKPVWCANHGVATSMYYDDPDGNRIELSVENFRTREALNAWLAGGDFNANPIGVTLDPDELARKLEAGVPEAQILRPAPDHRTRLQAELARHVR
ncbi:MAG TPA: VOC family protein [Candidatus Binataceae bacterium]|nr:VOC family protein [Candidatus Binataceae bacterium]